jgi:hypothetical protein
MLSHAYLTSNVPLFNWLFMQIIMVKKSAKSQVFHLRKMVGVTFVVTNVKLVVVHDFPLFHTPLKKLRQGKG